MRTFLVLLVIAGLAGLFYYQKHSGSDPAKDARQTSKPVTQVQQQSQPTAGQPSEHNWMKRSLDRASEVAHESRAQTQKSQDP